MCRPLVVHIQLYVPVGRKLAIMHIVYYSAFAFIHASTHTHTHTHTKAQTEKKPKRVFYTSVARRWRWRWSAEISSRSSTFLVDDRHHRTPLCSSSPTLGLPLPVPDTACSSYTMPAASGWVDYACIMPHRAVPACSRPCCMCAARERLQCNGGCWPCCSQSCPVRVGGVRWWLLQSRDHNPSACSQSPPVSLSSLHHRVSSSLHVTVQPPAASSSACLHSIASSVPCRRFQLRKRRLRDWRPSIHQFSLRVQPSRLGCL